MLLINKLHLRKRKYYQQALQNALHSKMVFLFTIHQWNHCVIESRIIYFVNRTR